MENEFDEKAFTEEVLRQAKEYLNHTKTVDEAITSRKEEIADIKENFKALWKAYGIVSKSRNQESQMFKETKIRLYLYSMLVKLLSAFYRKGTYDEIMGVHDSISLSLKELKQEKELLNIIKNAIKELEKYQATDCNYDMSLLLSLINEKNALMYSVLKEDVDSLRIRMKGFDYSSNTNYREDLKDIDASINNKVNELKLIKSPNI